MSGGRFTFTYAIGEQDGAPVFAVLDVPLDLTDEQEAKLRRLITEQVFGSFVESIAEWRLRVEATK